MNMLIGSMRRLPMLAALMMASTVGGVASADYTFNLTGATFDSGGLATGFVTTNNALTSVTSFNIVTTAGKLVGNSYTPATDIGSVTSTGLLFIPNTSSPFPELALLFNGGLTLNGPINIAGSFEIAGGSANRALFAGSLVLAPAASVPEPASAALLGLGLAGAGVAGWRRSRRVAT